MIDPKKADLYAAIGVALACMNKHPDDELVMGAARVLVDFIRDEQRRHNNVERDPWEEAELWKPGDAGPTYKIVDDGRAIYCRRCGKTSWSWGDVMHKYCVACDAFHTEGTQ